MTSRGLRAQMPSEFTGTKRPNKSAARERRDCAAVPIERHRRGVGEPSRSAMKCACLDDEPRMDTNSHE
jgi:hypothetical protein